MYIATGISHKSSYFLYRHKHTGIENCKDYFWESIVISFEALGFISSQKLIKFPKVSGYKIILCQFQNQ